MTLSDEIKFYHRRAFVVKGIFIIVFFFLPRSDIRNTHRVRIGLCVGKSASFREGAQDESREQSAKCAKKRKQD